MRMHPRIAAWRGFALALLGWACGNVQASTPATVLQPLWEHEVGTVGEACNTPQSPWGGADLHADGNGNLFVLARSRLTSLDPAGAQRWSVPTCPGCEDGMLGGLAQMEVTPGGQVWAVETRQINDYTYRNVALHRISPEGEFAATVSLVGTPFEHAWLLLAADEERAVLVGNDASGLHWFGMDASGTATATQSLAVVVPDRSIGLLALRLLPDGDLLLALRASSDHFCFPAVPGCLQPDVLAVLRTAFDGVQRWRHDTPSWTSFGAFDATHRFRFLDAEQVLRTIADDGNVAAADTPLHSVYDLYAIAGPHAGHLLMPTMDNLLLVDQDDGQIRDAVGVPYPPPANTAVYPWQTDGIRATSSGFLVPLYANPTCDSAVIYETHQLRERYRLRSPLHACPDNPEQLHGERVDALAADDGALTVLHPRCDAPVPRVTLARYALPGTPAGGLLFRDGFDP